MPSAELNEDMKLTRHFAHYSVNERWCGKMVGSTSLLSTLLDYYSEDTITCLGFYIELRLSTLISGNSAFDKNLYQNDSTAMSDSAKRGRDLFFSERLECFHCHGSFNFSQSVIHNGTSFDEIEFHNNGLYNIGGTGAYPDNNRGLWEFTFKAEDIGRFRAPTLRNVELTAPYMHDGSIATLEDVIDHYARGGRKIESGEYAGDGARSPFKSEFVNGFVLTEAEKTDLLNFLKSLTDWEFVCDKHFSDPFGNQLPHPNCPQS